MDPHTCKCESMTFVVVLLSNDPDPGKDDEDDMLMANVVVLEKKSSQRPKTMAALTSAQQVSCEVFNGIDAATQR
jgi:hypothetical protein